VRPPRLVDKPLGRTYRTSMERNVHGGRSISRAAVAEIMLACLEDDATIGQIVRVAY
jgi:NAD(P)H-binding